jgi:signal transduction histidine kinase
MDESWPDTKLEKLAALRDVGVQLAAATDSAELTERVVDSIILLTGAKRAAVIGFEQPVNDWGDALERAAVYGMAFDDFSEEERTLISEALATGRSAILESVPAEDAVAAIPSHGVMVTPLKTHNRITGALYAESDISGFDSGDLTLFETLALFVASGMDTLGLRGALTAAEQESSEFVSLVTHQMRIPLTSISGYADLLLGNMVGSLSDQQLDFLTRIKRNADRMSVLVRDLSDINRLDSGRMQLELTSFDLLETVSSVAASFKADFEARRQEILLEVGKARPNVCSDRSSVRRILTTLLDNASRYTPSGGRIAVRVEEVGDFASVEVSDSGIGISREDQSKLFTPFFRSEDRDVREHVGWGLGLVVARRLVEAQGGEITCTSESGTGSTFAFSIPLAGKGIC